MIIDELKQSAKELINNLVFNYDNCVNCYIKDIFENTIIFSNGKNKISITIGRPLFEVFPTINYIHELNSDISGLIDYEKVINPNKEFTVSYNGINIVVKYDSITEYAEIIKKLNELKNDYYLNKLNNFVTVGDTDDIEKLD